MNIRVGYCIFILSIFSAVQGIGQEFLNGDFENNSAVESMINLSNEEFNETMEDTHGFGAFGNLDIMTDLGVTAQSGDWFIGVTNQTTDLLTLALDAPLTVGESYTISFYDRSITSFLSSPIEFGLSTMEDDLGTLIHTMPDSAINYVWSYRVFSFVAPIPGTYLSIKQLGVTNQWVELDNFRFEESTPIKEVQKKLVKIFPNPANDLLNFEIPKNWDTGVSIDISILNSNGVACMQSSLAEQLEISNLEPGLYYVRIFRESEILHGRFVKL